LKDESTILLNLEKDNNLFVWRKRMLEDQFCVDTYNKRIVCDSKSGLIYFLRIENGELTCTCEGFKHRHTCRHLRKVQELGLDHELKLPSDIDSSLNDNYCRWCGQVFNKTDNYCGRCGKKRS
jgi:hypothetical protein